MRSASRSVTRWLHKHGKAAFQKTPFLPPHLRVWLQFQWSPALSRPTIPQWLQIPSKAHQTHWQWPALPRTSTWRNWPILYFRVWHLPQTVTQCSTSIFIELLGNKAIIMEPFFFFFRYEGLEWEKKICLLIRIDWQMWPDIIHWYLLGRYSYVNVGYDSTT